jgi:hypothetical protein
MKSRMKHVLRASWQMVFGARWPHDVLDRSRPLAVPLEPLGPWYYDLGRSIVRGDYHLFDDRGIPRMRVDGRVVYHASRVAAFSLAHVTRYVFEGRPDDRQKALLGARWLVDNQVAEGPLAGAFPLPFHWHGLPPPWASALTQGEGLSVLARAYLMTGDEAFARSAVAALAPFKRDVEAGGLRARFRGAGSVWYEEYPQADDPPHVLNGFVYALWGLRDVNRLDLTPEARELYAAGLASLVKHLPEFDAGYWSYYQVPDRAEPRVASLAYHQLHCVMMRIMAELEPGAIFAETARRWESCERSRCCRLRALAAKLGDWD